MPWINELRRMSGRGEKIVPGVSFVYMMCLLVVTSAIIADRNPDTFPEEAARNERG